MFEAKEQESVLPGGCIEDFNIKAVVVDNLPSGCWVCPLSFCDDDRVCGCRPKFPRGCLLLAVNLEDEVYEENRHHKCPLVLEE